MSQTTMQRIYIDRSRIETYQRCPRKRFIEYHQSRTGVVPAKKNIHLAVGGAVHRGLEALLRMGQQGLVSLEAHSIGGIDWLAMEEHAVVAALDDFARYSGALEVDTNELAAMTQQPTVTATFDAELLAQAQELGMDTAGLGTDRVEAVRQFDSMLYREQEALVEGLVRAYARYKLRPLLEQFEVLEVEKEGEWVLSAWGATIDYDIERVEHPNTHELVFMSRLDALLRERQSNMLHLQSYKTTGTWGDIRRLKAAEKDVQGLTEGVEVEQRLWQWWEQVNKPSSFKEAFGFDIPTPMYIYLKGLSEPPRIYAVRYEYLLKGERWEDKELSQRLGMTVRTQRSPLIRQYVARSTPQKGQSGYAVGDVCWSWDYIRTEDDKDSKLAWQNWSSQAVWNQDGGVKAWIDRLTESEILMSGEDSTVGMEPRALGWKSAAQKLGVTRNHPLEDVFPRPVVVFRNDDELRDVFEQIEAQERRVAEAVAEVSQVTDLGERRSLLNQKFPQFRHSCFYPTECWATKVCFAQSADVQADPLGAGEGKFVRRVPNHPQEGQGGS